MSHRQKGKDKEQLYDDVANLRMSFNACQEENTILRENAAMYEKESEEKDWVIKDLLKKLDAKNGPINKPKYGTHLISGLKAHIKKLQDEVKTEEKKISLIKRQPKFIQLGEMEVTIQILKEEEERLNEMLQDIIQKRTGGHTEEDIKAMNNTVYDQNIALESMKVENNNLTNSLQQHENAYIQITDRISKIEKNIVKLKQRHQEDLNNKKELKKLNSEIKKMNDDLITLKMKPKSKQEADILTNLTRILKEKRDLKQILIQKNNEMKELEEKSKSLSTTQGKQLEKLVELREKARKYEVEVQEERRNEPKNLPLIKFEEINKFVWNIKLDLMDKQIPADNVNKVFHA